MTQSTAKQFTFDSSKSKKKKLRAYFFNWLKKCEKKYMPNQSNRLKIIFFKCHLQQKRFIVVEIRNFDRKMPNECKEFDNSVDDLKCLVPSRIMTYKTSLRF